MEAYQREIEDRHGIEIESGQRDGVWWATAYDPDGGMYRVLMDRFGQTLRQALRRLEDDLPSLEK